MRLTAKTDRFPVPARLSPMWAAGLIIAALLLVFGLDRSTGSTPVQHLYYLPIILAGRRFGMRGGVIAALSAIVMCHAANPHLLTFKYEESDIVLIALFVAVGVMTAKLTLDANRLRRLATTDDLTGLHNLRSFETHLVSLVRAARETRVPLAMLVVDVDRLKSLNDQHGHLTGAEAVRTVGRIIGRRIPPEAVACRYGGDEFAIAVPGCAPLLLRRIADDLRRAVHDKAPVLAGRWFAPGTLSISVGASWTSLDRDEIAPDRSSRDVEAGEALFSAADAALYRAEAGGRNRISVA